MMKRCFALLFLVAFSITSFSQSKREWTAYGDAAFKSEDYKSAINYYLKVLDKNTNAGLVYPYAAHPYTPPAKKSKDSVKVVVTDTMKRISRVSPMEEYVTHQLADAYRLNHDYKNAEVWFKKSVDNKPVNYLYERFWYGDALMKNKKYPAASIEFESVMIDADKKDSTMFALAQIKKSSCSLARDLNYVRQDISIKELDTAINTGTANFAVNYYGDPNLIQFTTARDGNIVASKDADKAKYTTDIYTVKKTENRWTDLKKVDGPANTEMNEGAGFLTMDHNYYYFTRWSTTNKSECSIYLSKLFHDKWAAAEKLNDNVNLAGYKTMQPTLSPDGSKLYFSSNRPGGFGKMDIWYVNVNEEGKPTGKPVNMGSMFNTSEDEVTPFFHAYTSTLYYSSNGLAGFGGLDVFKSTINSDSLWSAPKNMGSPINSSKDDAYFVLERSQQHGYLTSDRKECANCEGGACYKIYSFDKEANVFDISGTVYNSETNQVVSGALITFKDIRSEKEDFYLLTDSMGNFSMKLQEGQELYIKAQKNRFFGDAGNISALGLVESEHFVKDFFLSAIPQGDIVIPGIEYDYDKATLRSESKKVLDDLADFLKLNNNLSVEISSYTDAQEGDAYNMKLSEDRARTVVDYLVKKGISKDRLIAHGYGKTKLLIPNAKTEEEQQKNRRTAFKLLKEGEIKQKVK